MVIEGQPTFHTTNQTDSTSLEPGDYLGGEGKLDLAFSVEKGEAAILYVRAEGRYEVLPSQTTE